MIDNLKQSTEVRSSNTIRGFVQRHPFLAFVALTLTLGWLPWYVGGRPSYIFFMPFLTGLIIAAGIDGRKGLGTFIRRIVRWRAPWYTWGVAIFVPGAVTGIAVLVYILSGGQVPTAALLTVNSGTLLRLVMLGVIFLLPLGSDNIGELSFRGLGIPILQKRWGPLVGTLILGTMVGLWFLPAFFNEKSPQFAMGGLSFLPFFLLIEIGWSIPMTWVYNKSGGSSLISGYIFHSAFNFWTVVLMVDASVVNGNFVFETFNSSLFKIYAALVVLTAVGFIISTKGRLGKSDSDEQA